MSIWTQYPGLRFHWPSVQGIASQHNLDPLLVAAIVITESGANTDAFRYEPAFYNRYIKPKGLYPGLNPRRASSSYGLMQLMYPVAVERGFTGYPEDLFRPEIGLMWGCRHLRVLTDWAATFPTATDQQRYEAIIASYNGGRGGNKPTENPKRNVSYVRKVLANLDSLRKESLAA